MFGGVEVHSVDPAAPPPRDGRPGRARALPRRERRAAAVLAARRAAGRGAAHQGGRGRRARARGGRAAGREGGRARPDRRAPHRTDHRGGRRAGGAASPPLRRARGPHRARAAHVSRGARVARRGCARRRPAAPAGARLRHPHAPPVRAAQPALGQRQRAPAVCQPHGAVAAFCGHRARRYRHVPRRPRHRAGQAARPGALRGRRHCRGRRHGAGAAVWAVVAPRLAHAHPPRASVLRRVRHAERARARAAHDAARVRVVVPDQAQAAPAGCDARGQCGGRAHRQPLWRGLRAGGGHCRRLGALPRAGHLPLRVPQNAPRAVAGAGPHAPPRERRHGRRHCARRPGVGALLRKAPSDGAHRHLSWARHHRAAARGGPRG